MTKKNRKKMRPKVAAEITDRRELEDVRTFESAERSEAVTEVVKTNSLSGAMNIFAAPARVLFDPVRKVCYPPLLSHWEKRYLGPFKQHAGKMLALDLLLLTVAGVLAVSTILVWMLLPPVALGGQVIVRTLQPETMVSGEATRLVVGYENDTSDPLLGAELTVDLPDNFVTKSAEGAAISNGDVLTYALGDIGAHARGQVTIDGRAFGAPNNDVPIVSRLSYWKSGEAQRTTVPHFAAVPIRDSVLSMSLGFDSPLRRDTVSAVRVSLTNSGAERLTDLAVKFLPPDGFRVTGSSPMMRRGSEWRVAAVEPGATIVLSAFGILPRDATPSFAASANVTMLDGTERALNRVSGNADAIASGLDLTLDVIGSSGSSSVGPGEEIEVRIGYANSGAATVRDLRLALNATERFLTEDNCGARTWDQTTVPELAEITPGQSGSVTTAVRVREKIAPEDLRGDESATVRLVSSAEYSVDGEPARVFRTDSAPVDLPVSSTVELRSGAIYFTEFGDQIGVGPMPPIAGKSTKMWIALTVANGVNPVRDARVQATLTDKARWTGRMSVADGRPLVHVPSSGNVTWDIGDIAAFAGELVPEASASFEVEIVPDENDTGKTITLVEHLTVTGEDTVTGVKLFDEGETVEVEIR